MGVRREAPHAAILKNVATNICGSDQHMVRGRTTAPVGQSLGHEITGEVVEVQSGYVALKVHSRMLAWPRLVSPPCPHCWTRYPSIHKFRQIETAPTRSMNRERD